MTRELTGQGRKQGQIWEGLPGTNGAPALRAYLDDAGVPTIGWGHTKGVKPGDTCTEDEANAWLDEDLAPTCAAVEREVDAELNDHQFAALVWFAFNVGIPSFAASTLVKRLNQLPPDYDSVPEQLAQWKYITRNGKKVVSKGLINRRALETALWLLPMEAMKPAPPAEVKMSYPTPDSEPVFTTLPSETRPVLTNSDLRQVPTTSATPVAPPTKALQTRTGQGTMAALFSGGGGLIISGFTQAQQVTAAVKAFFDGVAGANQFLVLGGVLFALASIGFMGYVFMNKRKSISQDNV